MCINNNDRTLVTHVFLILIRPLVASHKGPEVRKMGRSQAMNAQVDRFSARRR